MATNQFKLPGFGLPLNFIPYEKDEDRGDLFSNTLIGRDLSDGYADLPLTTLREFTMMQLMNQLTEKSDWHTKIFDDAAMSKWKVEALATEGMDITENMVEWCIAELRYKADSRQPRAVSVYNGDVVKSDTAIPASLKEALKKAIAPLEDIPARHQDWHPRSKEKVLDLVDPSLFPLIYGRSRILPDRLANLDECIKRSGDGEVIAVPPEEETFLRPQIPGGQLFDRPFSKQFQWLPCEVDIHKEGGTRITSYINNLHPKNTVLYTVLEDLISHTIPLWDITLTRLKLQCYYERILYSKCEYDPDPEAGPATDGPQQEDDEDDDGYNERREEWYVATRRVVQPEPGAFVPPTVSEYAKEQYFAEDTNNLSPEDSVDLRRDYAHRGLQVIVKLANIHLTSEKPEYEGGTWLVEGQLNEHICASAIYCYDSENITTSQLAFRQKSNTYATMDFDYEQGHDKWLGVVFGCEEDRSVQDTGTVNTSEGRLVTWPNILQYRDQPFKLVDPTKPGHQKIIALFLVDPNIRIISTANVPCQQRDWWSDAIQQGEGALSTLPVELQNHVFTDVEDFPIGLEEAKGFRLQLMEEREKYVAVHDEEFNGYSFALG